MDMDPELWTDIWTRFWTNEKADDDHFQITSAHAYFTSPSPLLHVFLREVVMDKSRPIVISSDSESDSEMVIANYDLSFTPSKIKR